MTHDVPAEPMPAPRAPDGALAPGPAPGSTPAPDPAPDPDPGAAIRAFVDALDVEDLITRFDVDFDVPMRQSDAVGMLRLAGAYAPVPDGGDIRAVARRVGAYWCEIVQADMAYEPLTGLRLIEASRADAERLLAHLTARTAGVRAVPDDFLSYVAARWYDGVGRIRYRLGDYTPARIAFGTATQTAMAAGLWWVLPDLRSNRMRADFEERSQTARDRPEGTDSFGLVPQFRALCSALLSQARTYHVALAVPEEGPPRHREFLRGYANALHNLATALRQDGDVEGTMDVTAESLAVARALGDTYRVAQTVNLRAQCDPANAVTYYEGLLDQPWPRGARIARQNLAIRKGGPRGLAELGAMLDDLERDEGGTGRQTGMDVDFYAYTVRGYARVAGQLPPDARPSDVLERRLTMARTVRGAVALPVYKRAYARHMRPAYLQAIAAAVLTGDGSRENLEQILSLVEESSGRELLDLLGSSRPPVLAPPGPGQRQAGAAAPEPEPWNAPGEGRRAAPQPLAEEEADALRDLIVRREQEYEEWFLQHPLTSVTHDEDIAHQLVQYTLNHQGACVVRYFGYAAPDGVRGDGGEAVRDRLGVMVCRDGLLTLAPAVPYEDVRALSVQVAADLAAGAPTPETCHRIWELLIAPVWDIASAGGPLTHLTLIPTDDLFAMPLHAAAEPGDDRPLAARVPLSHSVSVAAFVSRGRHLLKRQLMERDDDLAALLVTDADATGREVVATGWDPEHIVLAGDVFGGFPDPSAAPDEAQRHPADWSGVAALVECKPEFFVYAGHGTYVETGEATGPLLNLGEEDVLTQFDLALHLSLPRNKLTVLGACLAGQGMRSDGGDVLGFMRSLMVSGAGAIGVPLWKVLDTTMVATVRALLRGSRAVLAPGASGTGVFDVVEALHRHYRDDIETYDGLAARIERLPLALYL
ncbi:CHAT domain-containing protein [Actinacidiphila alni]|uniref:CHAT domain-containing protein n=1 Tax=Actinacidiphila alni TaxID=380248 RepID=UPI0034515883